MMGKIKNLFEGKEKLDLRTMLYYETAYREQNYKGLKRATPQNHNTFGDMIDNLDLKVNSYDHLLVLSGDQKELLKDKQAIRGCDLWKMVKERGPEVNLVFSYDDRQKSFIVNLKNLVAVGALSYMRVTIMCPDFSEVDDLLTAKTGCDSVNLRFVLSYADEGADELLDVYADALVDYKMRKGMNEELNDDDRAIFAGQLEICPYSIDDAGEMFKQHRFYDAYVVLKYHLHRLKQFIKSQDCEEFRDSYSHVCRLLYDVLLAMGFWDESYSFAMSGDSMQSEVLAMAASGDADALGYVDTYMDSKKDRLTEEEKADLLDLRQQLSVMLKNNYEERNEQMTTTEYVSSAVTVGEFLNYFHIQESSVMDNAVVVYPDGSVQTFESASALYYTPLQHLRISNVTFLIPIRHVFSEEEKAKAKEEGIEIDCSTMCQQSTFVLHARKVSTQVMASYFRCNGMQTSFAGFDYEVNNSPESLSVIVGTSIHHVQPDDIATMMDCIGSLMNQNRMMEAYRMCYAAFNFIHLLVRNEDGTFKEDMTDEMGWLRTDGENSFVCAYYDILYKMGFCLVGLSQFSIAKAFLSRASDRMCYSYIEEYLNCLSNSDDPEAMEEVEDAMEQTEKEPEGEEAQKRWKEHRAFLKRRKAYLLVEQNRRNEAVQFLSGMLDDPLCKDFALKELRYLSGQES